MRAFNVDFTNSKETGTEYLGSVRKRQQFRNLEYREQCFEMRKDTFEEKF